MSLVPATVRLEQDLLVDDLERSLSWLLRRLVDEESDALLDDSDNDDDSEGSGDESRCLQRDRDDPDGS